MADEEHPVVELHPPASQIPIQFPHPKTETVEIVPRPLYDGNNDRIDANFLRIEEEIVKLQKRRLERARRRTASAARINPDRLWFGYVIVAMNAVFAIGALSGSFVGQYELAPRTHLPEMLWWVVPASIDLPIMSAAFTGAVYRRRKQSTWRTWWLMGVLTFVSTVVNVVRVLDQDAFFRGTVLSVADWVGVAIMGILPSLVLVTWENLARLLIKPTGETRDADSDKTPAPRRRSAPSKTRSTK